MKIIADKNVFMRSCSDGFCMNPNVMALLVICIAAISVAGCMTYSTEPAGTPIVPISLPPTTPVATASPEPVTECTSDADCVPAECCHPSGCTAAAAKQPCNLMCTMSCEGPLDCGAGSCGCVNKKCSVIPASSVLSDRQKLTAISVKASPQRFSPFMSSTPGIGLEPLITGFSAQDATFTWKATYGHFLSWNSPDFKVNERGDSTSNHGEKLYWSFIDKPSSTGTPVTIAVTATDTVSGRVLGSSAITLAWDGDYAVIVKNIE
jgi:hypothetical protein